MFESFKRLFKPANPLPSATGSDIGFSASYREISPIKEAVKFKKSNQLELKSFLESAGVQKALQPLKHKTDRLILTTPNFQRYRNIYNVIPEAASVINTLVSRLPNLELVTKEGFVNLELFDELDFKYNLTSLAKNIALQYLIQENVAVSFSGDKDKNGQYVSLDGFFVPPLNELSLFQFERLSIKSLYWFNPNFNTQQIKEGEFYFYKGTSADNQFFGDSKLEPLYNSIYNLYKDGQNFTSFLDNNSFPGVLFLVPGQMEETQRLVLRQAIDEWGKERSRFQAGLLEGAEGLTTIQPEMKINVVDVPSKEYIWKTIATSYSVPSELFLRTGGLGQGEQTTMLENLKNNALLPLSTVVNMAFKHFILPKIEELSEFTIEEGSRLRISEISVETLTAKGTRLMGEVMNLGRPLIDYYQEMEGLTKDEAYSHYDTYYQPSGVQIQRLGETVTTTTNKDGQILEGQSVTNSEDITDNQPTDNQPTDNPSPTSSQPDEKIQTPEVPPNSPPLPSNPTSPSSSKLPVIKKETKKYSVRIASVLIKKASKKFNVKLGQLNLKANLKPKPEDYFQKYLSSKQKKRIKEFSFHLKADGENQDLISKLFEKKEYNQIQSSIAEILTNSYLLNYQEIIRRYPEINSLDEIEIKRILDGYKYNTTNLNFLPLANPLYITALEGLANAEGQMKSSNQDSLKPEVIRDIKDNSQDMILGRLSHYSNQKYKLKPATANLLGHLPVLATLSQYDYKHIDLTTVSKNTLLNILKDNTIEDKEGAFQQSAQTRSKLVTDNEILTAYGLGNSLGFLANPPKTKTKLPTLSSINRETHQAINGEMVKWNNNFSNGSFTFPDPNSINCKCSIQANYD